MTDERFKEYMHKKALARKQKILEVRALEKAHRKEVEGLYTEMTSILADFRTYAFIVLKNHRNKPITVYNDTSYSEVRKLIEEIEAYYNITGEMIYTLYRHKKLS